MSEEVPLVPGEVRAYRVWKFAPVKNPKGIVKRLMSTGWTRALDPAERVYTAECVWAIQQQQSGLAHRNGATGAAPEAGCTCGFYATYVGSPLYTYEKANYPAIQSSWRSDIFVGSVLLSGRVVFGDQGVARAQRMRIESVFSMASAHQDEASRALAAIGELYGVSTYSDPAAFVHEHPLDESLWMYATKASGSAHVETNMAIGLLQQYQLMGARADGAGCPCPMCRNAKWQYGYPTGQIDLSQVVAASAMDPRILEDFWRETMTKLTPSRGLPGSEPWRIG
jgi:hypothetical protein